MFHKSTGLYHIKTPLFHSLVFLQISKYTLVYVLLRGGTFKLFLFAIAKLNFHILTLEWKIEFFPFGKFCNKIKQCTSIATNAAVPDNQFNSSCLA